MKILKLALILNTALSLSAMAANMLPEHQQPAQALQHVQHPPRTLDQIPRHELMCVVQENGFVSIIDLLTHQVVDNPIPVGNNPRHAVLAPNGQLYVVNMDDSTISVINTEDNTVMGQPIPVGSFAHYAVLAPDNQLYVMCGDGSIFTINTEDNTVEGNPIQVGPFAHYAVLAPDNQLYVMTLNGVQIVDLSTRQVGNSIAEGDSTTFAVLDPNTGYLYMMSMRRNTVLIIDTATNRVVNNIWLASNPTHALIPPLLEQRFGKTKSAAKR